MMTASTTRSIRRTHKPSFSRVAEESVAESAEILERAFSQLYLEGDIVSFDSPDFLSRGLL